MHETTALSDGEALVRLWRKRLDKEKSCKSHEKFRKQAEESAKAAIDQEENGSFNIQWANCRILRSAVFSQRPKPDVRRRYVKNPDPEEKNLALLVERALEYQMDTDDFESSARAVVKDFIEVALGVPRVVYNAQTAPQALSDGILGEFEQPPMEIVGQSVGLEHVPWKHFHWEPGNNEWTDVEWVAFEYYDSAKNVRDQYGVYVKPGFESKDKQKDNSYQDEVHYYEIWDKPRRRVIVIADTHPEPLEVRQDELGLKGFFPCPRPAFDNLRSDELIPKPDFELIKKRTLELNRLTQRRAGLVEKVKPVELFDASIKDEVQRASLAQDGARIPVVSLAAKMGSAGLDGMFARLPMADLVATIRELDTQIESVKNQIYEVIGISDIVRGATKASETAAAQQIKGQWANVRLQDKTAEVNRMFRDVLRMMAEIICEHFDPMQLQLMTGVEVTPRMMEMMHSDIGRTFAIDVETDSTVLRDDTDERQQKLELVGVLMDKLNSLVPAVQQGFVTPEFAIEILTFSVGQYKNAKQLEDAIQGLGPHISNLQQFQQQMANMQQQLEQGAQQMQQLEQQNGQLQGQLAQFNERKESREDAKVQADIADKQARLQIDGMDKQTESGLDQARTDEIYHRMAQPTIVGIAP